MAKLSIEQRNFLIHHKIPLSKVFDATGMKRDAYSKIMSELEMSVAFGVTPCREMGHQMRTRPGHCAICKPERLAFQSRHEKPGYVYVAHSPKLKLVKIGTTGDTAERIHCINRDGYGGTNDWVLKFAKKVNKAGQIEFLAQEGVAETKILGRTYKKEGFVIECQELFSCEINIAIQSVASSI